MIRFYEYGSSDLVFTVDTETGDRRDIEYAWTNREIEQGADLLDHGNKMPPKNEYNGILSAHRVGQAEDRQAVIEAVLTLEALADQKTIFTVIREYDTCVQAVITALGWTARVDGDAIGVRISFQPYQETTYETTEIPNSRLRNPKRGKSKKAGPEHKKNADDKLPTLFKSTNSEKSWWKRMNGSL